jgi:hypothetical protein
MPTRIYPTLITKFAVLVEDLNVLATLLPSFYSSLKTSASPGLLKKATAGIGLFLIQLKQLATLFGAIGAKPSLSNKFVSRAQWGKDFLQVVSAAQQIASSLGAKPGEIKPVVDSILKWYKDNIAPYI